MPTLSKSKIMLGCGAAHIIPWALFCAFLTLYVSLKRSSPAAKCSSCEADLCNQTRKQPAQTACLEKCPDVLEEAQRGYREENDKLSALLAQADRSMTDLQIHLHTCQMQLKNLEDNVTAGVAEASIHEVEKRIVLEEELMHLKRQLKEQREKCHKPKGKNQQQTLRESNRSPLLEPIMALLSILFGGIMMLFIF